MTKEELSAALAEGKTRAKTDGSGNDVPELVLRILTAASGTDTVRDALKDVKAGRALLRFTDIGRAIEYKAGAGELHAPDGSCHLGDAVVPGERVVDVLAARHLALAAHLASALGELLVVREDHPALAGEHRLGGMEAGGGDGAE